MQSIKYPQALVCSMAQQNATTVAPDAELPVDEWPDISDSDARYAVEVQGRIEYRFASLGAAQEQVDELDQKHIHGNIVDTQ